MKTAFLITLLIPLYLISFSQDTLKTVKQTVPVTSSKDITIDGAHVFVVVEENATFQGGDINTFRLWVMKNTKYPESAREMGIEGKVIVQFVINANGDLEDIKILRTLDLACDAEVIKTVKKSPKWVPGRQGGKVVKQQFILPIIFKLSKPKQTAPITSKLKDTTNNDELVYIVVDENATFQGGDINTFRLWVMSHTKYPEMAREKNIQGKVIAQFVVNSQGDVEMVRILRSLHPICDDEVIRVIKASPKWLPGKHSNLI